MARRSRFAFISLAFATWLLMATAASAHQRVTIDNGLMTITGNIQKPTDLVTVGFDAAKDEFIVGHDILDPIPEVCYRDAAKPFQALHCPRAQVNGIYITTGGGSDAVRIDWDAPGLLGRVLHAAGTSGKVTVDTGGGTDAFEGGAEVDDVKTGGGSDKVSLGAGNDSVSTGGGSDKAYGGPGADTMRGGGASDKLFGQGGADSLFGGGGTDKLIAGGGDDECDVGPGSGKEISC